MLQISCSYGNDSVVGTREHDVIYCMCMKFHFSEVICQRLCMTVLPNMLTVVLSVFLSVLQC